MNELDNLIKQKREIENKIKLLKNQTSTYGFAKVDVERYPTSRPDRYYLAIHYTPLHGGRAKWQTIFSATDRKTVIDAIPMLIENMKSLYENIIEQSGE